MLADRRAVGQDFLGLFLALPITRHRSQELGPQAIPGRLVLRPKPFVSYAAVDPQKATSDHSTTRQVEPVHGIWGDDI